MQCPKCFRTFQKLTRNVLPIEIFYQHPWKIFKLEIAKQYFFDIVIILKRGLFSEGKAVFSNSKNQPILLLISITFENLILLSPSQTGIKQYDNTAFSTLKTFISPPY